MTSYKNNTIAVHSAPNSVKVIRFVRVGDLNEDLQDLYISGNLYGLYQDQNGDLKAVDLWNNELTDKMEGK